MAQRFENKSVLILGGSSGIGLATAKAFLAEGARVALTGRDPAKLEAVWEETGARTLRMDLGDLAEINRVIQEVVGAFGKLDVLFVNAGSAALGRLARITPEAWDECFNSNVRGSIFA